MADDGFRFVNSILSGKEPLDPEDVKKNYNAFFNNKALSQHVDCILNVNALNMYYQQLTATQQYDYYFRSIRKMRRKFGKWGKKNEDERIDVIMRYHDYSYSKAKQTVDLFTDQQFAIMTKEVDIGG